MPGRAQRRRRLVAALAAVGFGLALIAVRCGGGGGGSDAGTPTTEETTTTTMAIPLDADVVVIARDVTFPTKTFTAPAGRVTIAYKNEGMIRHTLDIEDVAGWTVLDVDRLGVVDVGTIDLPPGEYVLYCTIPGHRKPAGMEAVLTVEG
jgi:uncharacterized cupredoxin-like copper-binding protein